MKCPNSRLETNRKPSSRAGREGGPLRLGFAMDPPEMTANQDRHAVAENESTTGTALHSALAPPRCAKSAQAQAEQTQGAWFGHAWGWRSHEAAARRYPVHLCCRRRRHD